VKNMKIDPSDRRLMLTELPTAKTREEDGQTVLVQQDGVQMFLAVLFMKPKGQRGEEIKVTLETDPGAAFEEGDIVELIEPRASFYSFKNGKGETVSGIAYRAVGMVKVA
jgi:hypothetical protein